MVIKRWKRDEYVLREKKILTTDDLQGCFEQQRKMGLVYCHMKSALEGDKISVS